MKIVVVQPYARTPGHYDRETQRSCEAFARLGNDVTLVTYCGIDTDGHEGLRLNYKLLSAKTHKAKGPAPDSRSRPVYRSGIRAYFRWQLRDFRTSRMALSLARQTPEAITHFFDSDPNLLILLLRLMMRKKRPVLLMTIHQVDRPFSPSRRILGRVNRWAYRCCLARLIDRDLDGLVVFDVAIKQAIIARLKIRPESAARIHVLPHGIGDPIEMSTQDEARRRLGLPLHQAVFLIFGVLRADKRVDLAIEAMHGLSQCKLVIVGGPQDFTGTQIRELAHLRGCEQAVIAEADYVPEHRMHDYFSACDAVIIPYSRTFKGQSGILTLACGHRRAVIATDVGTLGEAVKRHRLGFAVEPDSASALHQGILRFISLSPEEREQLEQRVHRYASLASWDNTCKEWLALYQSLLDGRRLHSQPNSRRELTHADQ